MTVKELKEALNLCPDHQEVYLAERSNNHGCCKLNSISRQEITFEDYTEEDSSSDTVLILKD